MNIVPGRIIKDIKGNQYIIEKQIGSGGFANVFRIKDIKDNRIFALKTLLSGFEDKTILKSFKNEIKLSKEIKSENVIKYLSTNDGDLDKELPPYIIMEYADGGTLNEYIKERIDNSMLLTNEELRNIFLQLINGMKAINDKIVHRDIKPENILVKDNVLKISDFGLAKVANNKTRISTFKGYGTAMYVAPEGWNNDNNTIQMDIYSMGIVFYQLATLRLPYSIKATSSIDEIMRAHLYESPMNPLKVNSNLNPTISTVILKMLEKSTIKRFSNWDEIEKYLMKDSTTEKPFDGMINMMLANRIAKDTDESIKHLEEVRKKKQEEEFCKLVKYQFNNDIYIPLKSFIDEFNSKYPNKNISITPFSIESTSQNINIDIQLLSGEYILIKLVPILESDFIRETRLPDYLGGGIRSEVKVPVLRKRKVKAWGGIYNSNSTGFNIVLLENEGDIYGQWYSMENTNSGLSRNYRIQPFAFNINELEKEIQYVDATHIYNTDVSEFDIDKIFAYMSIMN